MKGFARLGVRRIGKDVLGMLFAGPFGSMLIAFAHHEKVVGKSPVDLQPTLELKSFDTGMVKPFMPPSASGMMCSGLLSLIGMSQSA
jgi:hypothetical protein